MIAYSTLLMHPAKSAGIKVPEDIHNFQQENFPHWMVYRNIQIGLPMPSPDSHWKNAKIIAAIPDEKIRIVSVQDLEKLGIEGIGVSTIVREAPTTAQTYGEVWLEFYRKFVEPLNQSGLVTDTIHQAFETGWQAGWDAGWKAPRS